MADAINHPKHYTSHPSGVECITIAEHMGFNLGNALKYIWRADLKGGALEDLQKARWYLDREIAKRGKQMQLIHSQSTKTYSYILTEDEWYSGTEQQKHAWVEQIKREAAAAGATNVNILVDPDATMSISPEPRRHRVFHQAFHTQNTEAIKSFRDALLDAYAYSRLTDIQKATVAREVFGL